MDDYIVLLYWLPPDVANQIRNEFDQKVEDGEDYMAFIDELLSNPTYLEMKQSAKLAKILEDDEEPEIKDPPTSDDLDKEIEEVANFLQPIVVLVGGGIVDDEYDDQSEESETTEETEPEETEPEEETSQPQQQIEESESSQEPNPIEGTLIKVLNVQGIYAPIVQFSIQEAGYCPEAYSPYFGSIMDVNGNFVDLDGSQHAGATYTCQTVSTAHHPVIDYDATQSQIDKFVSETDYLGISMDPRDNKFYGQ